MRFLIIFTTILVVINFQCISADDSCNEESLRECLTSLQKLIEDEYSFVKKTEDQLNEYCLNVQKDSTCLQQTTESCKEKHRLISALSVTLFNHLNQLCTPGTDHRKLYEKLSPCFEKHSEDFVKCTGEHLKKKYEDPQLQKVCLDMESMLCVAEKSRHYCGADGSSLAKTLEFSVDDSYHELCIPEPMSGSIGVFLSYWVLASSVSIAFLYSHRIKN